MILNEFQDDVPKFNSLIERIQSLLDDNSKDLEDVQETIQAHLADNGIEEDETITLAINIVFNLCDELPETDSTFHRLIDYIEGYDCWNAYNRLLTEFRNKLDQEKHKELFSKGKEAFAEELTKEWE